MSLSDKTEVVISTTHGSIRGLQTTSVYDDTYFSFESIPFAQPPLGQLRFKAPQPMTPWTTVLDCTQKPNKPVQLNQLNNEVEGSEDCLYLNIYAKQLKSSKPLPVMICLYGGGFVKGDPSRDLHGPDYFMMKDVILITIAYRLGALGFLSLTDPTLEIPGNAGLKDQLLALKWISQNVSNFNGDPNNITLFGESAGAASTHYMMLSPLAKGLFHKAILMSGNVLCPWALHLVEKLPLRLAQTLDYKGGNTEQEVLEYLLGANAHDIVRPYIITKEENLDDCLFTFGPVVEPYESDLCIIPQAPVLLLRNAWGNEIPVIVGGTSFEGLLMYARVKMAPFLLNELKDNCEHMLPFELKRKYQGEKKKALGNKLRQTHFMDKEINMENILNYCDYASYKVFWHPIYRTVQSRLRQTAAPTFLYRFDFDSPDFNHQRVKYCGKEVRGVAHCDDHSYIFYGTFSWKLSPDSPEFKTIKRMINIWTSFAANSNPSCEEIQWPPLHPEQAFQCLNISNELKVIDLPELNNLKIWEDLYKDD